MKTVAFIPVRGGSKSVKGKNIMKIAGKPLVYYTVKAACDCEDIDKVFVSTDSDEIKNVVEGFGFANVEVIGRSAETATDTATSESALLEFCNKYDFEQVVFLQATSPMTTSEDLSKALKKLGKSASSSMISAVHRFQFLWTPEGCPMNYNPQKRPRRQDWNGYYIENGAFYISDREDILNSKCRISGSVEYYEMPQETLVEVDEPEDWKLIEKFIEERNNV